MRTESIRGEYRPSLGSSSGESRVARPRKPFPESSAKLEMRSTLKEVPRRPQPTRRLNDGSKMVLRKRISSPVPKEDIGSIPYISTRSSAPPDMRQIRSLSPLSYTRGTSEAGRNRINKIKERETIPTSSKARPKSPVTPDYSALRSLPAVMHDQRFKETETRALNRVVTTSHVSNKPNKESREERIKMPITTDIDDELFKIGPGPISAGVSSDSRRASRGSGSKLPNQMKSPFDIVEDDPMGTDKPPEPAQIERSCSLQSNQSAGSGLPSPLSFWTRRRSRNKDGSKEPTTSSSLFNSEISTDDQSSAKSSAKVYRRSTTAMSKDSDKEVKLYRAASSYFGISIKGRKKSSDRTSQQSWDDLDTSVTPKIKRKLPKIIRRLGKALNTKSLLRTDSKAMNLKKTLHGLMDYTTYSGYGPSDAEEETRRSRSGRSMSSCNTSDCSTIDMEEIRAADPKLYSTIIETVASWCEGPVAEPDDAEDALSTRTFSSISFRERSGGPSQDLSNFEFGSTLAAEAAFLEDVVKGKVDTASNASGSPKAAPVKRDEADREMQKLIKAVDRLCDGSKEDAPRTKSPITIPSSFFQLTDSESDDDIPKDLEEDFLHLTSSEMESMEVSSMKEVLKMQGIWLYNWGKSNEIKELAARWIKSECTGKYLSCGLGLEITVEDRTVKCYRYPRETADDCPLECVYIEAVVPPSTATTISVKGTLTSMGLRTT